MKNCYVYAVLFCYAFLDFVQVCSETSVGFIAVLDGFASVENGCVVFVSAFGSDYCKGLVSVFARKEHRNVACCHHIALTGFG